MLNETPDLMMSIYRKELTALTAHNLRFSHYQIVNASTLMPIPQCFNKSETSGVKRS